MIWAPKGDKSQQKSDLGLVSSIDDVGDAKIHVEMAEVGDICSCRMAAKSGYERCGPSQAQKKKMHKKTRLSNGSIVWSGFSRSTYLATVAFTC